MKIQPISELKDGAVVVAYHTRRGWVSGIMKYGEHWFRDARFDGEGSSEYTHFVIIPDPP